MSRSHEERSEHEAARRVAACMLGALAAEGCDIDGMPAKHRLIKDLPERTWREIKVYASARDITVAQAVVEIVTDYLHGDAMTDSQQPDQANAAPADAPE